MRQERAEPVPGVPLTQGEFLTALGIRERAAMLRQRATPEQAADIDGAVQRLIGETEMGTLFKVLALTGPGQDAPAGFEPRPALRAASGPAKRFPTFSRSDHSTRTLQ